MPHHFDYLAYRSLLRDAATRWKREHAGGTLQRIATKAGVQAPYLTNVLKERAHLSGDQLHALGLVLGWDQEELDYAALLLEWERSAHAARRTLLKRRIEELRQEKLKTKANLKKEVVRVSPEEHQRFFLNPYYSLLNAFLGVGRFAREPERVARCLGVPRAQVKAWLRDLVRMQFLRAWKEGGYERAKTNFHLPTDSPLCEPHQNLLQQLASQQVQRLPADRKYIFQLTFSADPATRERVQREFLDFLKRIEPLVKEAPAEELYGMRFDLFQWSHEAD
jgi:uncharacterized protein (TIGR02147 family)